MALSKPCPCTVNLTEIDYRGMERKDPFWKQGVHYLPVAGWIGAAAASVSSLGGMVGPFHSQKTLRCVCATASVATLVCSTFYLCWADSVPQSINFNPSPGLAWSFYDGYMKVLSKGDLNEIIKDLKAIAIERIIILFPFEAEMQHNLEILDGVSSLGKVRMAEEQRGGQTMRPYEVSVYELHYENEYYYCMIEGGLGIDHINQMMLRHFSTLNDEDRKKIKVTEHSKYVKLLEDYTSSNERDKFMFLLYNGEDKNGNTTVKEIVEGIRRFCYERGAEPLSFDKRMNVAKRIKDMRNKVVLSDNLVQSLTFDDANKGKEYIAKLKGEFVDGEEMEVRNLSFQEVKLAKRALAEIGRETEPKGVQAPPEHVVIVRRFVDLKNDKQNDIVNAVSQKIGHKWKNLYRTLMIHVAPPAMLTSEIENIEYRKRDEGQNSMAQEAIESWIDKTGRDADVEQLNKALRKVGHKLIADEISDILSQSA